MKKKERKGEKEKSSMHALAQLEIWADSGHHKGHFDCTW